MAPKRNPTASGSRGEPDSRGGTTRRAPPYPPRGGAAPHPSGRSAPTRGAVEGAGGSARRAPAVRDDKALADAAAVALHSGAGGGGENDTRGDGGDCPEELVGAGEIVRGEEGGALGGMGVFGRDGVAGRDVVPDEQAVLGVGGVPDDGPVPDVFLRESPGPKGVSCESSGPRAILCESHAPDGGESAGTPSGATLLGTRETPPDVRALGASLQGLLIHAPAAAATRDYPATPAFPLADDHVRTTRGHAQDVRVPASRGDSAGAASALFAAGFGGGARSESSAGVSATSSRMTTRDGYLCQDPYCGLSGGDYEGDEDTRQLVVDVGLRLIASFRGEAVSSANALRSWANSVVKKNALQEVVAFMGPRLVMKVIGLATRARNKDVGLERHLAEAAAEGVNERDAFIGYLDLVYDHWGQEGATRLGPRMSPAAMPFKWRSFHEELYARFLSMGETPASTREESSGPRVVGLTLVREYAESAVDNADCACRPSSAGAAPPTTRTSTAAAQVDPQRIDLPWPANDAPARFSLPDVSGSTPVRVRASPRRSLGGLEIGRQAVDRRASRNSADKVARSGEILRRQARQAEFEIPPPVVLPTTPSRNRVRGHVPSSLGHRRAFKNYCGIDPSHPDSDGNDGVGLKPTMDLPDYGSKFYDVNVFGYRPSMIPPAATQLAPPRIVEPIAEAREVRSEAVVCERDAKVMHAATAAARPKKNAHDNLARRLHVNGHKVDVGNKKGDNVDVAVEGLGEILSSLKRGEYEEPEHRFVVGNIEDRLEEAGPTVSVSSPKVIRLPRLLHLATDVQGGGGDRREDFTQTLLNATHPTPAVCGVPRAVTMERLRGLERLDCGSTPGRSGDGSDLTIDPAQVHAETSCGVLRAAFIRAQCPLYKDMVRVAKKWRDGTDFMVPGAAMGDYLVELLMVEAFHGAGAAEPSPDLYSSIFRRFLALIATQSGTGPEAIAADTMPTTFPVWTTCYNRATVDHCLARGLLEIDNARLQTFSEKVFHRQGNGEQTGINSSRATAHEQPDSFLMHSKSLKSWKVWARMELKAGGTDAGRNLQRSRTSLRWRKGGRSTADPAKLRASDPETQALRRKLMRGSSILIIQGGYSGKRFIYERLHELGVHVTIMDGPDTVWRAAAEEGVIEEFIPLDFTDNETVFARAMEAIEDDASRFDGLTSFYEEAIPLVASMAAALGLDSNPVDACETARNKRKPRQVMAEVGLPVPTYRSITSRGQMNEACKHVGFPAIIKPVYGVMSMGVHRVDSAGEAHKAYDNIIGPMKTEDDSIWALGKELVFEEYYDGEEFDIDILLSEGKCVYSNVLDNWQCMAPFSQEIGMNSPTLYPRSRRKELIKLSANTTLAFGFRSGVFHVECRYTSRGPRMVEVNTRMGNSAVRDSNLTAWGVDLVEDHAMTALRIPIAPVVPEKPMKFMAETCLNAPFSGVVENETWLDNGKKYPEVTRLEYKKKKGESVMGADGDMPDWLAEITVVFSVSQEHALGIISDDCLRNDSGLGLFPLPVCSRLGLNIGCFRQEEKIPSVNFEVPNRSQLG